MKKTRSIAGLLAVVLLFLLPFSGCEKVPERTEVPAPIEGPKLADLKETDTLVIYVMQSFQRTYMPQIEAFRKATGVDVEVVSVVGEPEEFTERVINDMVSGSGPDVLYFSDSFRMDITKSALNGNFLDLTDILAEDPDFSEDDYIEGVFDACQVNGRQYTVPTSYDLPFAFSVAETLADIGFRWDGIDTMSDFIEEIAHLTPEASENNSGFQQMMNSKNYFKMLYRYSGIRLLDYENGVVLPDEKELREFLEAYKLFFPYDYDASGASQIWNRVDPLLSGIAAFWIPSFLTGIVDSISIMKLESLAYAYRVIPSQTGEIVARISSQLAIPANAKNTANAYRFIKFLLSEEMQLDQNVLLGMKPIRKSAIHKVIYETPALYENHGFYLDDPENLALTEDEAVALEEAITSIDRFMQDERVVLSNMLQESMLPYFRDEASYEDCLADLKNKLTLYLSE